MSVAALADVARRALNGMAISKDDRRFIVGELDNHEPELAVVAMLEAPGAHLDAVTLGELEAQLAGCYRERYMRGIVARYRAAQEAASDR